MKSHEHGAYFQFTLGSLKPREFPFEFINRSHLNKGCYGMLHTPLKCNLVNFDIPNGFMYYTKEIDVGISKLARLHFKRVCTSFIHVRSVQHWG